MSNEKSHVSTKEQHPVLSLFRFIFSFFSIAVGLYFGRSLVNWLHNDNDPGLLPPTYISMKDRIPQATQGVRSWPPDAASQNVPRSMAPMTKQAQGQPVPAKTTQTSSTTGPKTTNIGSSIRTTQRMVVAMDADERKKLQDETAKRREEEAKNPNAIDTARRILQMIDDAKRKQIEEEQAKRKDDETKAQATTIVPPWQAKTEATTIVPPWLKNDSFQSNYPHTRNTEEKQQNGKTTVNTTGQGGLGSQGGFSGNLGGSHVPDFSAMFNGSHISSVYGTPGTTVQGENGVRYYYVDKGDGLQVIAHKMYGKASMWRIIQEANNLNENTMLKIGQRLVIPPAVQQSGSVQSVFDGQGNSGSSGGY